MPSQLGGAFNPASDTAFGGSVSAVGTITCNTAATGGVGYSTGAGGAVTQLTNKSTAVTLNKLCGTITMNGAALSNATAVGFSVNNSLVAATDVIVANLVSANTANSYTLTVDAVAAGSFKLSLYNFTGGSLSEAVVINFAVIKSVSA